MKNKIIINEMILRDGLQSLPFLLDLDTKFYIYKEIIKTGIYNIEFGSTTSSKLLLQMKDSYKLFDLINNNDYNKVNNYILCTSKKGIIEAINRQIKNYSLVYSLCDKFSIKNLNKTYEQNYIEILEQLQLIKLNGYNKIRIYISSCFGSIFNENNDYILNNLIISLNKIYEFILDNKINYENFDIVLADTFGLANEVDDNNIKNIIKYLEFIKEKYPLEIFNYISLHLHLDNSDKDAINSLIDIGLSYSIKKFDSSISGIGGCPFGEKNKMKGNLSTLYLVKYLKTKDYDLDVDLEKLKNLDKDISHIIYKNLYN